MDEIDLPLFYILNRHLSNEQVPAIQTSLRITPVDCSVVFDVQDVNLATQFSIPFFLAKDEPDALDCAVELSQKHQRRALVIGHADLLDACYADGRKEPVACTC